MADAQRTRANRSFNTQKNESTTIFVDFRHDNEKYQNNEKSDAAYLKPMRAGDGKLKISLPWPNEKSDAVYLKPMQAGDSKLKILLPWP